MAESSQYKILQSKSNMRGKCCGYQYVHNIITTLKNCAIDFEDKYKSNDMDGVSNNIFKLVAIIILGWHIISDDLQNLNINDLCTCIDIDTFVKKLSFVENPNESIKKNMDADILNIIKYINENKFYINQFLDAHRAKRNSFFKSLFTK